MTPDLNPTGASQLCPTCGRRYPYFDPRELVGKPCFDCEERAKQPSLFEVHLPATRDPAPAPDPPKRPANAAMSRTEVDAAMSRGATRDAPLSVYREHARERRAEDARFPTRSAHEALALLQERRGTQIDMARDIAVAICRRHGTVHGRMVRDQMQREGLLQDSDREFWLGAVFNDARFEWTGQFVMVHDGARNLHTRAIKLWKLKGDLPEGREETTESEDSGVAR